MKAYIALGSNLGDRAAWLEQALKGLREHPAIAVLRVSSFLETAPVGGPEGLRVAVGSVVDRPALLAVDADHPGESAAEQVEPFGSLHGSADYLRHLVRVVVDRVVERVR